MEKDITNYLSTIVLVGHPVLYALRLYIRPTLHPSYDTSDPPALGFLAACIAAVGPMCTRPCSLSEKVEKDSVSDLL